MALTDKDYNDALIRYLEKSGPKMWHQVAMNWNWDGDNEPLTWMIRQPKCDSATALLIYWHGAPAWYCQYANSSEVKPHEMKTYTLIKEIEQKYSGGFYSDQNIYFDPADDDGTNWTAEYQDKITKTTIPPMMYKPILGKKLERVYFDDGYPDEVLKEMEEKMK
jgi:hypothetical protein